MKKTLPGISEADKQLMIKLLPKEYPYELQPETITEMCRLGKTVLLKKGDNLIDTGEYDPSFYILIDGLIRCYYWNGDKEETEFFSSMPTTFLDYHSSCGDEGSLYCYEACTDCKLIRISKNDYDQLVNTSFDFAKWRLLLTEQQIYYFELKKKFFTGDAKERYDSFIKNLPDIMDAVPLRIVASYLHITPQHLSRLRRRKD